MDSVFPVVEFISFFMHLLYHNAENNSTFALLMLRQYADGVFTEIFIFRPSEAIPNDENMVSVISLPSVCSEE